MELGASQKRRAIRDDFKTSVENLVQEMFGQIDGILMLRTDLDFA